MLLTVYQRRENDRDAYGESYGRDGQKGLTPTGNDMPPKCYEELEQVASALSFNYCLLLSLGIEESICRKIISPSKTFSMG
jgi:hypothetical protein